MINEKFRGKYWFLSNMCESPVNVDHVTYPTVENAYQASKTLDHDARVQFATCNCWEAKQRGGKNAKKHGFTTLEVRADWNDVKEDVMERLLQQKFTPGSDLAKKLLATGDEVIIHYNEHGDFYWGVCKDRGENKLGLLLMKIRNGLQAMETEKEGTVGTGKVKLVIFGGRDFNDYALLERVVKATNIYKDGRISTIISGGAAGADKLGERFARENDIRIEQYLAAWDDIDAEGAVVKTNRSGKKYNALAGFWRNEDMAIVAEAGLGFWNGKTPGTKDMIATCEANDVKLHVVMYDQEPVADFNHGLITCRIHELKSIKADIKINIARKDVPMPGVQHVTALAPSAMNFSYYWDNKDSGDWWDGYVSIWKSEKKDNAVYWDKINKIAAHISAGRRVAIACFCEDESHCHRSLVRADIQSVLANV